MRPAFIRTLTALAEKDRSIHLITSDTGFKVFENFQATFPDRYLNIGISEACMIGVAAGLALSGKRVFCYGIVPFVTLRCFEQIRVDLCAMNLPVTVVGVGEGLTYSTTGSTHHSIEDLAVLGALPNLTIVCPADPVETALATEAIMGLEGPCYLRLGKTGEPVVHEAGLAELTLGKAITLSRGRDLAILATGNMVDTAVRTGRLLRAEGFEPEVVSLHTVKPLDRERVIELARRFGRIVTIEEHSILGGLGARVSDVLTDEGVEVSMLKFALRDEFSGVVGSHQYLRDRYGLTPEAISAEIIRKMGGSPSAAGGPRPAGRQRSL